MEEYNSSNIKVLDDRSHLLKRMGLIFGPENGAKSLEAEEGLRFSTQKGVAVREVLDNAMDEIRGGYGTHVKIRLLKDGSVEIQDSGRGLPVDISEIGEGKKAHGIYKCLGMSRSSAKFGKADYKKKSSGQNGVGGSSTIQVSKRADITVFREGKKYTVSFKDGVMGEFSKDGDPTSAFTPYTDLTKMKISKDTRKKGEKKNYETGTIVKFWLNEDVFSSPFEFSAKDLISRIENTAFLTPQSVIEVYSEVGNEPDPITGEVLPLNVVYNYPEGLPLLVERVKTSKSLIEPVTVSTKVDYIEPNVPVENEKGVFVITDVSREVDINISFTYGEGYDYKILSFVNTIYTRLGGVHVTAFEKAIVKAFNEKMATMRGLYSKDHKPAIFSDFAEGLTAIVSIEVPEPSFSSQAKEELSGADLQKAVEKGIYEALKGWINERKNNSNLNVIAQKVSTASKNRQAEKEKKDLKRVKNKITSSALPPKLVDCARRGAGTEIFITEGDSAGTAVKSARYSDTQAIMPLRGKVLNAIKASPKDFINNEEVQNLSKVLGVPIGEDGDWRYEKVIIMTDADVDGKHIDTLLVSLLYKMYPETARDRLYKIETPLFVITVEKKPVRKYCYSDIERDRAIQELVKQGFSKKSINISRLKGLGEVPSEILRETACNPKTRRLIKFEFKEGFDNFLEMALGNKTQGRKEWILSSLDSMEEDDFEGLE